MRAQRAEQSAAFRFVSHPCERPRFGRHITVEKKLDPPKPVAEDKPKAREQTRAQVESWITGSIEPAWVDLATMAATLQQRPHPLTPFSAVRQLPPALDEAARVDGLSALQRIALVHVPVALPAVATTAILVFIFCWNEFMLAVTFMTRDERKTVTAGIASVSGASVYEIPWGQLSAAVLIATLPLLLLVLFFQRRIVAGLTRGAVKG